MSGKSTIAGTLPGKTLLIEAAVIEAGSDSAAKLAKKLGNNLEVIGFTSLADLVSLLDEARTLDYDNIFIDGVSAVTDMKLDEPEIQKLVKKDQWGAYREIGASVRNFLKMAKSITAEEGKNVFITLAMNPKRDANGHLVELTPAVKGNVAVSEISKLCRFFGTLRIAYDEDGNKVRELVTLSDGVYLGRIDGLLEEDNPGVVPADLGVLLELVKG